MLNNYQSITNVDKEEEKNHCGLNIEIKPNNTLKLFVA